MWSSGSATVGTTPSEAREQAQLHGKWWLRVMQGVVARHVPEPVQRPPPSLQGQRPPSSLQDSEAQYYGSQSRNARDQEVARLQEALEKQRASAESKVMELKEALEQEQVKSHEHAGTILELEVARQEVAALRTCLDDERERTRKAMVAAKEGRVCELAKLEAQGKTVFLVDNSELRAKTDGLHFRRSKSLDDKVGEVPGSIAKWGSWVSGYEHKDGWVEVGKHFLPKSVKGNSVLRNDIYLVDSSSIKASTHGLAYRNSKSLDDKHPSEVAKWGSLVSGVDEGDGWLRVGDAYLPFKVDKHSVLMKHKANVGQASPAPAVKTSPRSRIAEDEGSAAWKDVEGVSPTQSQADRKNMPGRIVRATTQILNELHKLELDEESEEARMPLQRSITAPVPEIKKAPRSRPERKVSFESPNSEEQPTSDSRSKLSLEAAKDDQNLGTSSGSSKMMKELERGHIVLQQENEALRDENAAHRQRIESLTSQLQQAPAAPGELMALQQQLQAATEENIAHRQRIESLTSQLQQAAPFFNNAEPQTEEGAIIKRVSELQLRSRSLELEGSAKRQLLEEQCSNLENRLGALRTAPPSKKVAEEKAQHEARQEELEKGQIILQQQLEALGVENTAHRQRIESLTLQLQQAANQKAEALQAANQKAEALDNVEFTAMANEVFQLRAERDTLQAEVQKHIDGMDRVSEVMIPDGLGPGDDFIAAMPDGSQIPIRVPDDASGGCTMEITVKVPVPDDSTLSQKVDMLMGAVKDRDLHHTSTCESLEAALADARSEQSALAKEHIALGSEHSALGDRHRGLAEEHSTLADQHQQLAVEAAESRQELRSLKRSLAGMQEAHEQLCIQRDRDQIASQELEKGQIVLQQQLEAVGGENTAHRERIENLTSQLQQATQGEDSGDTKELMALQQELEAYRGETTAQRERIESLTLQLQQEPTAPADNGVKAAELERYQVACADLESLNQQLGGQVQEHASQAAQLQATIQRLTEDYDMLLQDRENMATQAMKEREMLQGQVQNLSNDYGLLSNDHRNQLVEVEEWRRKALSVQEELQELQAREPTVIHREVPGSTETFQAFEAEVGKLQTERTVLIEELAQMKLEAQQLNADYMQLEIQNQQVVEEAQQLRESQHVAGKEREAIIEQEFFKFRSTFEARVDTLTAESNALREELSVSKEARATLMAENGGLKAELRVGKEASSENNKLLTQLASAESSQKTLQAENARQTAENDRLMADILAVGSAKNALQAEHDRLVAKLQTVSSAHQTLQADKQRLQSELASVAADHQTLQAEKSRLLDEVGSADSAHKALHEKSYELKAEIEATSSAHRKLQAEHERLSSEFAVATAAQKALQREKSQLQSEVEIVTSDHKTLLAERSKLMSDISSAEPELKRMQAENKQLLSEVAALNSAQVELQAEKKQLTKELGAVVPEHADLRMENTRLKSEIAAIEPVYQALRAENHRLQSDNAKLAPELENLAALRPELEKLQVENRRLQAEMTSQGPEVERLQAQTKMLMRENSANATLQNALEAENKRLLAEIEQAGKGRQALEEENQRLLTELANASNGKDREALEEENQRLLEQLASMSSPVAMAGMDTVATVASAATVEPRSLEVPEEKKQATPNLEAMDAAEKWVSSYQAPSVQNTPSLIYLNRIPVIFDEFASTLAPVAAANAPYRSLVLQEIESGNLMRRALATYKARDPECIGYLSWTSGAVRDFVAEVFEQKGLSPPSDAQIYELFLTFDQDSTWKLNVDECLCLADAAFRTVFMYPEAPLSPTREAVRSDLTRGITVEYPDEAEEETVIPSEHVVVAPVQTRAVTRKISAEARVIYQEPAKPEVVIAPTATVQAKVVTETQAQPIVYSAETVTRSSQPASPSKVVQSITQASPSSAASTKMAKTISVEPASPASGLAPSTATTRPMAVEYVSATGYSTPSAVQSTPSAAQPRVILASEQGSARGGTPALYSGISGLGTPGGTTPLPTLQAKLLEPQEPVRMAQVLQPAAVSGSGRFVQSSSRTQLGAAVSAASSAEVSHGGSMARSLATAIDAYAVETPKQLPVPLSVSSAEVSHGGSLARSLAAAVDARPVEAPRQLPTASVAVSQGGSLARSLAAAIDASAVEAPVQLPIASAEVSHGGSLARQLAAAAEAAAPVQEVGHGGSLARQLAAAAEAASAKGGTSLGSSLDVAAASTAARRLYSNQEPVNAYPPVVSIISDSAPSPASSVGGAGMKRLDPTRVSQRR